MNMQYARAVVAHEQAYRDRFGANSLTADHAHASAKAQAGSAAFLPVRSP